MLLTKQLGRRTEVTKLPEMESISPGLQGVAAWSLLTPAEKDYVNGALGNAAEHYGCRKKDLQWKMGRGGELHVRLRPRIVIDS